jgi:hypothetical protein
LSPEDERRFLLVGMEDEKAKLKVRLDYLDAQIRLITHRALTDAGSRPTETVQSKPAGKPKARRRHISPEARQKMREAQQRRWARQRGETTEQAPPSPLATGEAAQV